MEKQFLSLFESAKKSADAASTSSMLPEVHRCLDALEQLKRFPVISSRVLLSTPVAQRVQSLTKHRVELIRTAASCLLEDWTRKLYARNPTIDQKPQLIKSGCSVSRVRTLIIKMHGRVVGRINKVGVPVKTVEIEGKKNMNKETGKGFSSFRKPLLEPVKQIMKPAENVKTTRTCFKNPPLKRAKQIRKPVGKSGKVEGIRSSFNKPQQASAKCITTQEKVIGFSSFKKPSEEPGKCDNAFRGKVRSILVDSLTKVVNEAGVGLWKVVSSCDPIRVASKVESVMLQKMGPFNGAKTMKYRSILFNLKDPKNPDLRRKVLLGQIKPEKLVTMTSEEMASNQRQFENEQIRIKSLNKEMKKAEQKHKLVNSMEY